jgi:HAD superfamily hydrolase (TIGR01450 family)
LTIADGFDAFLLDLDGVVWRGEEAIPGAGRTIWRLREDGKRVVFMTNNASRSPRQYAVKLMRMRIPTEPTDIVTSGHVVLAHLRRIGLRRGDRVHVCAAPALSQLLRGEGFVPTTQTRGVKALVVAWNPKVTFEDIRYAADVARTGVPFVAANRDATYPSEHGLLPGSGAIVAAIEVASGVRATAVGKPRPDLVRLALDRAGSDPSRTLVCGDRPDTDVAGARAAGLPVALVLTGVTLESDLGTLTERPDWILRDLSELLAEQPMEPPSTGPYVVGTLGPPVPAEQEDQDHPGDEPADVGQVGDPPAADLP